MRKHRAVESVIADAAGDEHHRVDAVDAEPAPAVGVREVDPIRVDLDRPGVLEDLNPLLVQGGKHCADRVLSDEGRGARSSKGEGDLVAERGKVVRHRQGSGAVVLRDDEDTRAQRASRPEDDRIGSGHMRQELAGNAGMPAAGAGREGDDICA